MQFVWRAHPLSAVESNLPRSSQVQSQLSQRHESRQSEQSECFDTDYPSSLKLGPSQLPPYNLTDIQTNWETIPRYLEDEEMIIPMQDSPFAQIGYTATRRNERDLGNTNTHFTSNYSNPMSCHSVSSQSPSGAANPSPPTLPSPFFPISAFYTLSNPGSNEQQQLQSSPYMGDLSLYESPQEQQIPSPSQPLDALFSPFDVESPTHQQMGVAFSEIWRDPTQTFPNSGSPHGVKYEMTSPSQPPLSLSPTQLYYRQPSTGSNEGEYDHGLDSFDNSSYMQGGYSHVGESSTGSAGAVSDFDYLSSPSSRTTRRRAKRSTSPDITPHYSGTKKSRGRRVPTFDSLYPDMEAAQHAHQSGNKGRTYVCSIDNCGKIFYRNEHLKRHMNSIHSEDKRFYCPAIACQKGFSRRDNMRQHMNIHRPEEFPPGTHLPAVKRQRGTRGSSYDL